METITFRLAGYAKNGAQMNRVMASWIIFIWHETSKFISSTRFQVITFEKKPCWNYNMMDWKKILTEEVKELNPPKIKWEYWLLQISSLYSMTNPLLWFQKMSADERIVSSRLRYSYRSSFLKTSLMLINSRLFWLLPTICLTFRQIWNPTHWKDANS